MICSKTARPNCQEVRPPRFQKDLVAGEDALVIIFRGSFRILHSFVVYVVSPNTFVIAGTSLISAEAAAGGLVAGCFSAGTAQLGISASRTGTADSLEGTWRPELIFVLPAGTRDV